MPHKGLIPVSCNIYVSLKDQLHSDSLYYGMYNSHLHQGFEYN